MTLKKRFLMERISKHYVTENQKLSLVQKQDEWSKGACGYETYFSKNWNSNIGFYTGGWNYIGTGNNFESVSGIQQWY